MSPEHHALRAAVRELTADKIAPYAAVVDEQTRFPQEAYDALLAADLHTVHVPAEYGGNGADALSACLMIEEVARGCTSSSLIPAVNKLGSLPIAERNGGAAGEVAAPLAEGKALGCRRTGPPPLPLRMREASLLGRKTGQGFFAY